MRNFCWSLYTRTVVVSQDEDGLTMLAYALGAGAVLAPLALAIFGFGVDVSNNAEAVVEAAVSAP
jgi:hypothetical protein